jgi:hypothetical protein
VRFSRGLTDFARRYTEIRQDYPKKNIRKSPIAHQRVFQKLKTKTALTCEYLRKFSKKGLNGLLRGLGKTDS